MTTVNNADCLSWKFPGVEGISTQGGFITDWPDELPELTQELVDSIDIEYDKATGHIQPRREAYAPIGDQLDMMYQDTINGTSTWKDHITKVKSDYPKK